jgi:predicted metal-binding transcription factor (methanogenesis marker protein 9)
LKELQEKNKTISLKEFMEAKPQLANGILDKLEPIVLKLVAKGQTRHTIV